MQKNILINKKEMGFNNSSIARELRKFQILMTSSK